MPRLRTFVDVCGYEFRMQLRRPAAWVATFLTTLVLLGMMTRIELRTIGLHAANPLGETAVLITPISYFLPIIFGILMADRLPRDRRLNTTELLDSLPTSAGSRLWGKYLGASTATMVPIFFGYLLVTAVLAMGDGDPRLISALFLIFPVMVVPGLLFVGAYSIACTEVLATPLYSILFVGYWFWGNVLPPSRIPTISCTPLTPIGRFAAVGLFQKPGDVCDPRVHEITWVGGVESIALLLVVGFLAIVVLQAYVSRRSAHQ